VVRHVDRANLYDPKMRRKLKSGRKAYFDILMPSKLAIGYQRLTVGNAGRWISRSKLADGRYQFVTIARADDFEEADGLRILSFAQAYEAARGKSGSTGSVLTVADAIRDYVRYLYEVKSSGRHAEVSAAKLILPQFGKIRISELTAPRINQWRDALARQPALARTGRGRPQQYKAPPTTKDALRARRASVNRVLTILKAALNYAYENNEGLDNSAWSRRVKRFPNVDAARPGYLTVEESQRLIAAASASFRPLVHAGLLTGCRYGELIALTCGDYQRGKIYVAQSKSGKPRSVTLSDEGVVFFDSMLSGRASSDPMFLRHDDKPWRGSQQTEPMQDACGRAGIVPAIGFHQLRHTWASLAIMNGMPLKLVARNLGHANTLMVEKHYGHLTESYIDREIRANAPRYNVQTTVARHTTTPMKRWISWTDIRR
jgi:integrase